MHVLSGTFSKVVSFLLVVHTICTRQSAYSGYSLPPSRLPSGKPHSYIPNSNTPFADLQSITAAQARFVGKHWVNNIVAHGPIAHEDFHLVRAIKAMYDTIHECDNRDVFLAWTPSGSSNDVLFIVAAKVKGGRLHVIHIIPSPFWSTEQISSVHLRSSLVALAAECNRALDLIELHESDHRMRLMWAHHML